MEELGVLVAFADRPAFPSLPPMSALPANRSGKGKPRVKTKGRLSCREITCFFPKVEKINQETAVIIESGNELVLLFPYLGGKPECFFRATRTPAAPEPRSVPDQEGRVVGRKVWSRSQAYSKKNRDSLGIFVEGGEGARLKGCVREGGVPRVVKECSVEPG